MSTLPSPPAPAAAPVDATDATFPGLVLASPLPVLVEFWAVWCAPCLAAAPLVGELAREHAGRLRVVRVDTDRSPSWPERLRIMGIPAFVLFRGGQEVARLVGTVSKATLDRAVAALLAG